MVMINQGGEVCPYTPHPTLSKIKTGAMTSSDKTLRARGSVTLNEDSVGTDAILPHVHPCKHAQELVLNPGT